MQGSHGHNLSKQGGKGCNHERRKAWAYQETGQTNKHMNTIQKEGWACRVIETRGEASWTQKGMSVPMGSGLVNEHRHPLVVIYNVIYK